ncbi:MAG: hypothetical protein RLZZ283_725 [Candidatus Parcubacteria bacterium]|jgi:hypothetical protein
MAREGSPVKRVGTKRSANGQNNAGWAVHWASLGKDTRVLSRWGRKGGLETARMNKIRSKVRITQKMRREAESLERIDAARSGFDSVLDYKLH